MWERSVALRPPAPTRAPAARLCAAAARLEAMTRFMAADHRPRAAMGVFRGRVGFCLRDCWGVGTGQSSAAPTCDTAPAARLALGLSSNPAAMLTAPMIQFAVLLACYIQSICPRLQAMDPSVDQLDLLYRTRGVVWECAGYSFKLFESFTCGIAV